MRKTVFLPLIFLLLVGGALVHFLDPAPAYTTSSPEAFALYEQGEQALNSLQYRKAEHLLQEALAIDPGFAMAQAALAELYRINSTPESHREAVARAESLAALLTDQEERLLVLLRASRGTDVATCDADSILKLLEKRRPKHPLVRETKAAREQYWGDPAVAKEIWLELLREDPNYSRAYNWLGYLAASQGEYEQALGHLQKYAFLSPEIANPHDSLGEILIYLGRYDEAERELHQALQMQPDFFASLLKLAQIYLEQGKLAKGIDLLEQTRSQIAGTHLEEFVDRLLISTYYDHHLIDRCLEVCSRFATRHPASKISPFYRALLLAGRGRFDEARAINDSALAVFQTQADKKGIKKADLTMTRIRHSFEAIFAEMLQQYDIAANEWETTLAASEDLPPHHLFGWRTRLGENLLKVGRFEEARIQAKKVLDTNPNLIRPLLIATEAACAMGMFTQAQESLDRLESILASADPDLPDVARADSLRALLDQQPSS